MDWKKLNKKQRSHLREHGIRTMSTLRASRKAQRELDPKREVCFDCKEIAIKLGVE